MRIVVIGAGLGGLTLAHGLRAAGLEVEVHERGPHGGPQPASYGIHVTAHGNRALRACLPDAAWERYDRAAVPAPDVVRFRDADLDLLADLEFGTRAEDADPVAHRRAVRREPLHRALRDGLDEVVHWDHGYASHEVLPDGRVRVGFTDGTTTVADLLVGADGSNSRVRRDSRPELVRHELGILTVAGRLPLDDPAVRALPAGMTDGSVNNVVPAGRGWMFASTWPSEGTDPGVLVWAFVAERTSYPAGVEDHSPDDLRRLVRERVGSWDPGIAAVVDATDPATVAPVALRSTGELPARRPTAVTLIGDAAHTMSPMAGIGAATALRDADTLRRALLDEGSGSLVERVGRYEDRMRGYANDALRTSTRNARSAASERRLPRLAFRTLLRLGRAVPPVRRRVFPATASR